MKLYKLTDSKSQTRNNTQWGPGVEHETSGKGDLCGPGWLHAYENPLLAVLLNPIHANFTNPQLWECEGDVGQADGQLKVGCTKLKTVREIPLPTVTTEQRIKFAILCVLKVCKSDSFVKWSEKWIRGEDRTLESARSAAAEAAWSEVAWSAAAAAARAAAEAAEAEAEAAAWSAAEAAARAAAEAEAEAEAVASATAHSEDFSLIELAEEAIK